MGELLVASALVALPSPVTSQPGPGFLGSSAGAEASDCTEASSSLFLSPPAASVLPSFPLPLPSPPRCVSLMPKFMGLLSQDIIVDKFAVAKKGPLIHQGAWVSAWP